MLSTRAQDLVCSHWRPLWLSLHRFLPILVRWRKVWVPIKVVLLELDGLDVHGLDLLEVVLVVQAVAEHVAKCAECAL
jgi:hypothetical protein